MPEVVRVARSSYSGRNRDDYSSDDELSSQYSRSRRKEVEGAYRTVQRYRITPSRVEETRDDRRTTEYSSSRVDITSPRDSGRLEVDRRVDRFVDIPERPRSAIETRPRSTVVERTYERDSREREPLREPERERTRTVVYERERPRDQVALRPWEREPERPWERMSERDRETDVRIEKRVERTERREEPYELERYQRETEYYDRPEPAPQPIIIRQRAPEPQQIIVQEAPLPPPVIVPRQEPEPAFQVIRQREDVVEEPPRPEPKREDEYYYRRDVIERGPRREEDFALTRYDRREVRPRDSVSDYSDDDGSEYVSRRVVRRRASSSPHRRRHLAEGVLAGAGAAALLANHREKQGNGPEHRGRQVVGGAALGAIGAEVLTRARSRYRESREERSRSRSRSSSRNSHSKVKTALGIAVAGLAAAAAVKYAQKRNVDKEELGRGRSRTRSISRRRSSYSEYSRSKSRHEDPKHRASQMAKAGAATAAVAGVVEHFRNKSRKRSGSRSKSRIRTGAEIAATGLAGAAVAGLYENRKAKEDNEEELEHLNKERRRSRNRSRATSVGAYSDPGVDPELGMVEYGGTPVYTRQTTTYRDNTYDPAVAAEAGAAYGATRHHKSHSRSHRRRGSYSSSSDDGRRRRSRTRSRSRSRSRARDLAGAALGTGAAAVGIHEYRKRKEKKEAERERERRRYEEEADPENYYANDYRDDGYSPSPPHASGGSYYPDHVNTTFPPPPTQSGPTYTQHTTSTTHVNDSQIPPYNPADYANQQAAHDAHGNPPHHDDHVSSRHSPVINGTSQNQNPHFPPPPTMSGANQEPSSVDHLHDEGLLRRRSLSSSSLTPNTAPTSPNEQPHNRSVTFAPLSPTSSRRLSKIRANSSNDPEPLTETDLSPDPPEHHHRYRRHRRRNSDPSSNRPATPSRHRRRDRNSSRSPSPSGSSDEVEVLPDRFDREGRPINSQGGGEQQMVERLVTGFGDVVEGRASWKDLLRGVLVEDDGGHGHKRRRR